MVEPRDDGFFSRWARRKAEARHGATSAEAAPPPAGVSSAPAPAAVVPVPLPQQPAAAVPPAEAPPPPTMDDVARLTRGSDFSPFVRAGVDEGVKRAALKKLFAEPHFNVMDGLDVYIDDYGKPDPLPASMLRKMVQSQAVGLWRDERTGHEPATPEAGDTSPAPAPVDVPQGAANPPAPHGGATDETPADEDADLRLQPLDAAGREGDPRDAGEDARRE